MLDTLLEKLIKQKRKCVAQNVRGLVVITGEIDWCEQLALNALLEFSHRGINAGTCWVSNDLPDPAKSIATIRHVHRRRSIELLGNDCANLVIQLHDGLDLNLLGRVANTLEGGGNLFLLAPAFADWPHLPDPDFHPFNVFHSPKSSSRNISSCTIQRLTGLIKQSVADDYVIETAESDNFPDPAPVPGLLVAQSANEEVTLSQLEQRILEREAELSNRRTNDSTLSQAAERAVSELPNIVPDQAFHFQLTVDQLAVVERMKDAPMRELQEKPGFYWLVIADRGRGKSTALGWGAAELLRKGVPVIVTASHKNQARNFFRAVALANRSHQAGPNEPRFMAPDLLARELLDIPGNALLIIEEAASIAAPLLHRLCDVFPRIIFSTTVHGYEGSGRGFYARFVQRLKTTGQPVFENRLYEPLRWSASCPLEKLINRLTGILPHDQEPDSEGLHSDSGFGESAGFREIQVQKIRAEELIANESRLQSVLALLASAHYQTQPNDLRFILDAQYCHLWVAEDSGEVVGALMAVEEGGLHPDPDSLANEIVAGRRRPPGNLLAQKMARETGESGWCKNTSLRVVRIAVAAECRRRGLGTRLLQALVAYAQDASTDYLGSSFGLEEQLPLFWKQNEYVPVFLGTRFEKASGARNLMVVRPLTLRGNHLVSGALRQLRLSLPVLRPRYMWDLSIDQEEMLLGWAESHIEDRNTNTVNPGSSSVEPLSSLEANRQLQRFINREIEFASIFYALLCWCQRSGTALSASGQAVKSGGEYTVPEKGDVIGVVIECAPDWGKAAARLRLEGKKQVLEHLRLALIDRLATAQAG